MSVVGEKEMKEVHEWRGPQRARLRRKFFFFVVVALWCFGCIFVLLTSR